MRLKQPSLVLNYQAKVYHTASEVSNSLCTFTQILSLNKYANLFSMWKSPATDYKKNKGETL